VKKIKIKMKKINEVKKKVFSYPCAETPRILVQRCHKPPGPLSSPESRTYDVPSARTPAPSLSAAAAAVGADAVAVAAEAAATASSVIVATASAVSATASAVAAANDLVGGADAEERSSADSSTRWASEGTAAAAAASAAACDVKDRD